MNTLARAEALAAQAVHFPILGEIFAADLVELVRVELGHAEILDGFRPYGGHFSKAVAASPILHIVSGNTPHAALQSLVRGLLLGARNRVKLPSAGLPEAELFVNLLPAPLRELVEVRRDLPPEWLRSSEAWIVYGSDETIAHFRKQAPHRVTFDPHPHRVSLGVVFDDPGKTAAARAAEDASLYDQKGCLSLQDIYVAGDARAFAEKLAEEMARFEERCPRGAITPLEAAEIGDIRANYRFRAASDKRVQIWESPGSSAWTVIYEDDAWFASSCLNRVVYVKPLPDDLPSALGPALSWVAGVGIWPVTPEHAARAAELSPSRICPLGRMQFPPVTWHQEGRPSLSRLTRWVDFEPNLG